MGDFARLELSTETLRQLTQEELVTVAGGNVQWTPACHLTIELGDKVRELIDTSATQTFNCWSTTCE